MITREYIYRGEPKDALLNILVSNFGTEHFSKEQNAESPVPFGIIIVFDELNQGWIAGQQSFYGWKISRER